MLAYITRRRSLWPIILLVLVLRFMERTSYLTLFTADNVASLPTDQKSGVSTTDSYDRSATGLGRRRSFSTHQCLGPRPERIERERTLDVAMYRSCHFTDVCFAPGKHPLLGYIDAKMRGFSLIYITHDQADDTEKELLNNPSQLKTMTKPQGLQMGPSLQKSRDGLYMTPRIVNQSTAALYRKHWSPIPVAIPFRPHQCTNFGHVLGDNVFAMFRILKNFGLYHPELQFLPIRADCVNKDECGDRCSMLSQLFDPFLKGPVGTPFHVKGIFRNYYKAALDISAKQHQQMKLNPSSLPLLCFENVLSGLYYYADHGEDPARHGDGFNTFLTGSGDKLLEFRDQYMIRLGLDPNRHLSNRLCQVGVESASILIVPRRPDSNRISGWHDDKLIAELQKTLPNENVTVVDFSIHGTRAQVKLASTAKVLVSMAGGASYLAWFLAPGASALVLKRWGTLNDAFIWENFPYIKKSYFSATSDSASNRTEEVFDYVKMSKSVEHLVQSYDRRFCEK